MQRLCNVCATSVQAARPSLHLPRQSDHRSCSTPSTGVPHHHHQEPLAGGTVTVVTAFNPAACGLALVGCGLHNTTSAAVAMYCVVSTKPALPSSFCSPSEHGFGFPSRPVSVPAQQTVSEHDLWPALPTRERNSQSGVPRAKECDLRFPPRCWSGRRTNSAQPAHVKNREKLCHDERGPVTTFPGPRRGRARGPRWSACRSLYHTRTRRRRLALLVFIALDSHASPCQTRPRGAP